MLILGTAVGRSVLVWCAIAARATAHSGEDLAGSQDCVPCGTADQCVPLKSLCDGSWDCPAGEDEEQQFCKVHSLGRRSRENTLNRNNGRINSRMPRPLLADEPSDFVPERSIRQMNEAFSGSFSNSTDAPRSPIIVRTVTSLNSTNTSNLIFIHLPDEEGHHPTLLPSLTRDASVVTNATILNRVNLKNKKSKLRSRYKNSSGMKECCGHCVRCASSTTCVAHSQICDGHADCLQMEDEAPAFCQVFQQGGCPSGLAPCNGVCLPWALACSEHCVQRPHFEACFAVRRKQLDISFLNKSSLDPVNIRIPFVPSKNGSHSVLRVALPANPLPQTLDPLHITRPANSPFPNASTNESSTSLLHQLHDEFIRVSKPDPTSQDDNVTSTKMSAYSSIIYKCSPISQEDRISSLLSANTLLLKGPTKSSIFKINSKDLSQTPEISNRNTFDRLKAALANIHRNLLNLNKTLNESRSSKFLFHDHPSLAYHCVLATNNSGENPAAENLSKDDQDTPGLDKDDVLKDLASLDRDELSNSPSNTTSTPYPSLQNDQSSLLESNSTRQTIPEGQAIPDIPESNAKPVTTTLQPPLSELMEMFSPPPPSQMMRPCPPIYTPVAHTCLAALPFPLTWQEAGDVCEKLGGQLAETRDVSMLTAVAKFLQQGGSRANFWIGGFYDIVTNAWMWRSGAKMKMSTPFWGYRHTEECSEQQRSSYNETQKPECTHQQAPLQSTKGFCAALDAEFFYFITDQPCTHPRKVLCSHNRSW